MASQDPSLARRLVPALALTGAGLGLINVLDKPVSSSAAGAAGAVGADLGAVANGNGAVAAGNTVPGITTVPSPTTSGATSGTAGSASASSGTTNSPATTTGTRQPAQTATTQPPSTASPTTNDCGALSANGSQESISIRGRTYGTVVVSAKFTSSGVLCKVGASYNVGDRRSVQIEEYAIPRLNSQAVAANSANINGISGATAISDAYSRSLQSAIDSK